MVLAREERPNSYQAFEEFVNALRFGGAQQASPTVWDSRPADTSARLLAALKFLDMLSPVYESAEDVRGEKDDNLDKSSADLLSLASAALRRYGNHPAGGTRNPELRAGSIRLNADTVDVFVDGRQVCLSPIQFKILALLVSNGGRMVGHAAIAREIWGLDLPDNAHVLLKLHIRNLRQRLGDNGADPRFIVNVRGMGYKIKTDPARP